ncbi:MAG: hypothetical protein EPN40_13265 [Rhodanobacteraceae bacterium]|nr:MAG: hypothetical protein EPN40_13265 [Rhodanobacteraceae bacterium]
MAVVLLAALTGCRQQPESAAVSCSLSRRGVALGRSDGIEYAYRDHANHRVYVSSDAGIEVWDADNGAPVGRIHNIVGSTAIVTAPPLNRGFAADGTTGAIKVFDLDTLEIIRRIPYADPSSDMVFDATTGTVAAISAVARDVRLIDAAAGVVVGDVRLAGSPRAMWSRGNGMLYLRLERPARIVRVNLGARKVDARWPWAACKSRRDLIDH